MPSMVSYLIGLAMLVLIATGGYYLVTKESASTGAEGGVATESWDGLSDTDLVAAASRATTPGTTAVVYTDRGFFPPTVTVKLGQKVRFFNQSGEKLWVVGDRTPSVNILPEFDENGIINKGQAWELTFNKVGSFKYGNQNNSKMPMGTVVVTK